MCFFRAVAVDGDTDLVAATIELAACADYVYEGRLPPPKGAPVEDWEDREQTLFRSTAFGDDVDRPLKKSDGSYTYFASDIAYHRSSSNAASARLIDVWGADHGGYIKRMQAAVAALSERKRRARRQTRPTCEAFARGRAGQNVEAGRRVRDASRSRG
jgi:arginyl-tRNA synthetase